MTCARAVASLFRRAPRSVSTNITN
jgi:tetratricopeptide (TPR) repeat protein